jgi:hypothetical protein
MTTASEQIDKQIAELGDWRGEMVARLRGLIHEAAPDLKEDWKWGTAVWGNKSNVCAIGAFKDHVKVNFFKGALLPDPRGLINAGLDAKQSRAIDVGENEQLDESAFKELVREAAAGTAAKK